MNVVDTQEATYQIWVELKANLHRYIARRARDVADADDILQEVFVKIHSNIGRLRDTTKLHAWVYQITRNAITDYYRTRRTDLSLDATPDAIDLAEERPEDVETDREEIMACLNPMVQRLPNVYQKALVMSDVQGITQARVADELNLSLSGAKSRVQRARGKVKDMLLNCCNFEFDRLGRAVTMEKRDCGTSCGSSGCD